MSVVAQLMIAGWTSTFAIVGLSALSENGTLLRIHRRIGRWLERRASPIVSVQKANLPALDQ